MRCLSTQDVEMNELRKMLAVEVRGITSLQKRINTQVGPVSVYTECNCIVSNTCRSWASV